MRQRDVAFPHQGASLGMHCRRLGGEARDEVGAEHDVRTRLAQRRAAGDDVGAAVSALHALEHHVIARLQAQMQIRHEPRLVGEERAQRRVRGRRVERRQTQLRQRRDGGEQPADHGRQPAGGGEIDAP